MLSSDKEVHEDPGQQEPMGFMASEGEFHDGNDAHWADQKQTSFTSPTNSENTNWETAEVCMSVAQEATRKATCRINYPL